MTLTSPMEITSETLRLPPEVEEGNREYKWKLLDLTPDRIIKLATQMSWRLKEDPSNHRASEAYYYLGVQDDGEIGGLAHEELMESLENLSKIAEVAQAEIVSREIIPTPRGLIAQVQLERISEIQAEELNLALVGLSGVGKTTLIQTLTTGQRDDGKGNLRNEAMKHPHEIEAGQTSSINYHLIGFQDGTLINSKASPLTWERIVRRSERVIEMIDLPGDPVYLGTTLFGLLSHSLDYLCLLIEAPHFLEMGHLTEKHKLYLYLALQLRVEFCLILTKTDGLSTPDLRKILLALNHETIQHYQYGLKLINKSSDLVGFEHTSLFETRRIPVLHLSSLTHFNLPLLVQLLQKIPSPQMKIQASTEKEFLIHKVLQLPTVGTVVSGVAHQGEIRVGDRLLLGPTLKNRYLEVTIKSIHRKQIPVTYLPNKAMGTLLLQMSDPTMIHKKMVLITPGLFSNFCHRFLLRFQKLPDWFCPKKQYTLFSQNQVETIRILEIQETSVGDMLVRVEFTHPRAYRYLRHLDQCVIRQLGTERDETRIWVGEIMKLHQMISQ